MIARRSVLSALLAVTLVGQASAHECRVPKERRLPHVLVALSNTIGPGIVNTAAGLLVVVGSFIAAPFSKRIEVPRFKMSPTGIQIIAMIADDWYGGGTSLGLFLIEGSDMERHKSDEDYRLHVLHEAGHAYQSAMLGPLYLPVVGVDYAVHGGGNHSFYFRHRRDRGGFSKNPDDDAWVETWADRIAARGGPTDELSADEIRRLAGCE